MKPREIVDVAKDEAIFSDKLAGKTPNQTMKAKISVDIRSKGSTSRFVRTAPNTFFLRELMTPGERLYIAAPQTPPGKRELVLTFPATLLDTVGRFQGISRSWRGFVSKVLNDRVCSAIPRLQAENQENQKQILTYVLVTRGPKLLCFRRGSFNRVEDYLRGSLCVGFGGHVSNSDRTLYNMSDYKQLLYDNAARELFEELRLPERDRFRLLNGKGLHILGLLNDDSSSTGRKHFAVILQYEASDAPAWDQPLRGEKSITQLKWLDLSNLNHQLREFEYWSQLCLSEFFRNAVLTQPSFLIRRKSPFRGNHVLCVIGGIGSGKSAATRVLTHEFGYRELNSGRILGQLLGVSPVPQTDRETFQNLAWLFIRRKGGPAKLAAAIADHVSEVRSPVLIDGIRQKATIDELRRRVAPSKLAILFVHSPPHIAYQFYRERSSMSVDIHEFLSLCEAPVEAEVKKLLVHSDAVLYNWTGKLQYERAVRAFMWELSQ